MLNTVDFRPPGIPPSGILIVRHMSDPLPGKVSPYSPGVRVQGSWEQAVQRVLQEKYRTAQRPVHGCIPANADAVFFIDQGQMLAALALDMSRGEAWRHWWWKVTLLRLPGITGLESLLCLKAPMVPALVHHLVQWQAADTVIGALSPQQTLTVLKHIGRAFAVEDALAPTADNMLAGKGTLTPGKPVKGTVENHASDRYLTHIRQPGIDDSISPGAGIKEPWPLPGFWPRDRMGRERTTLLGVSLMLYPGTAALKSNQFKKNFRQWWRYFEIETGRKKEREKPVSPIKETSIPAADPDMGGEEVKKRGSEIKKKKKNENRAQDDFTSPTGAGEKGTEPHVYRENKNRGQAASETSKTIKGQATCKPRGKTGGELKKAKEQRSGEDREKEKRTPAAEQADLESGPVNRTEPRPRTGRIQDIRFEDSGAPGAPAQEREIEAVINTDAALPLEGAATGLAGVFYLINLMTRLDLLTSFREQCGFADYVGAWGVLELLARALTEEMEPEPAVANDPLWSILALLDGREEGTLPGGEFNHRFRPWLSSVLPRIRSFLREIADSFDERVLLQCPGRVYVTSSHVDVVMAMEDISLPARMAGLDRDPGWMPDFARIILFRFE